MLPSGMLFINANLGTELFDTNSNTEYQLDDIPHSVRTYPGSAATAMLPLSKLFPHLARLNHFDVRASTGKQLDRYFVVLWWH